MEAAVVSVRRVLFVHTATLPPLGADTWVHAQIIAELDRSTHEVHAACVVRTPAGNTPTYTALASIPDLRLISVDFGPEFSGQSLPRKARALVRTLRVIPSALRLGVYIRRNRITIIHTSDRPRDAFVSVILARLTKAHCVVHVHVAYNAAWMGRMLRWSLDNADALIAVSEFVARTLVDGGHQPSRIYVVPNAIDPTAWTPGRGRKLRREEFELAPSTTVLVSICRLFPEKGPGELIRALAVIRSEQPDVHVLIVGQEMVAGYRDELVELVHRLDLDDAVTFTGRRSDIEGMLAASDIYVMPSYEEPFGLVFLEAMAMQVPVVALDNGGTPEVVEHGRTGLLSPPGDTKAVADNVLALIGDPDRRTRMGVEGRHVVELQFATARMARNTADVYRLVDSSQAG